MSTLEEFLLFTLLNQFTTFCEMTGCENMNHSWVLILISLSSISWAPPDLRGGLSGVSGSPGDRDWQAGDQSELLQSSPHDDHLFWCVLKTSIDIQMEINTTTQKEKWTVVSLREDIKCTVLCSNTWIIGLLGLYWVKYLGMYAGEEQKLTFFEAMKRKKHPIISEEHLFRDDWVKYCLEKLPFVGRGVLKQPDWWRDKCLLKHLNKTDAQLECVDMQ